jgi:hypothetical protein
MAGSASAVSRIIPAEPVFEVAQFGVGNNHNEFDARHLREEFIKRVSEAVEENVKNVQIYRLTRFSRFCGETSSPPVKLMTNIAAQKNLTSRSPMGRLRSSQPC